MSDSKNKLSFGLNVGSSSILLVFVLLCLVLFAALSIISANADNKLTKKVLERTTAYYTACNDAELTLSELDESLVTAYKNSIDETDYFSKVGHQHSYTFPISDLQYLKVDVEITYPKNDKDTFYFVKKWQVVSIELITEIE